MCRYDNGPALPSSALSDPRHPNVVALRGDRAAPPASGRPERDGLAEAMLDAALDCVVIMGADGRVSEWNAAAERTFGYSREHAVGKRLAELIVPPALREAHRRGLARYLATGETGVLGRRVELTAVRADGSELPVELAVTRVAGDPPVFAGYLRDITDRNRRDQELRTEARRRESVQAVGQRALEGLELPRLIEEATELAVRELDLDFCEVWELLPERDELLLRAGFGWPEQAADRLKVPVTDFAFEQRFALPEYLRRGIASGLSARIPGPERPFGLIAGHSARRRAFSESDVGLLESIGHVLGAAIERHRAEGRFEGVERRYRTLVERLPVVSYVAEYGPQGRWTYVSPQIEQMLGYTPAEWTADPSLWASRIHPDDRERVLAEEELCARGGGPLAIEYRMIARDGRLVWVRDESSDATSDTKDRTAKVEGLLADITEQKEAQAELRHRADHDALTGLLNRHRFEQELDFWLQRTRGAVLILDVDHLKLVNDSFGHAAGDRVLRTVAETLRTGVRGEDVLARLGGDEFAVLLLGTGEEDARARATELLHAVRSHDPGMPVTGSAGIAMFEPDGPAGAADLLVAADIALYRAKEAGRDRAAVFTGQEGDRLEWVGRVRSAIQEGRLILHAQPIVELATGKAVAHELLVRMVDTDGEIVAPGRFLSTAERFGLVRDIDRWVTRQAVRIAARGRRVSVNLSALSVGDPGLTRLIQEELAEAGAEPAHLIFEITETALAADMGEVRAFAERIERLGCSIALDDFGAGFGSFSYLKHLRPSYLKIDIEFVRELPSSGRDRRMVKSIIELARGLGMRTVAEGVEDARTLELLRALGADYAQGWHLGRPAPLEP
jgi:diguanylate cyclase (GGDEF)-like protein/PAS domain S-box-containing protein